jgi:hypothetical protein
MHIYIYIYIYIFVTSALLGVSGELHAPTVLPSVLTG